MTDNERVFLLNEIAKNKQIRHVYAKNKLGYRSAGEIRELVKQLQDEGYLEGYKFSLSGINKTVIGINYFTGHITEKGKELLNS